MARSKASPRARDLMERLRVVVGSRETIGEAAMRLRAHQASAAPLVSAGRPVGLLTRAQAENALRHGLGAERAIRLACGGAPRVSLAADLEAVKRASIGIAPGLVVGNPRGPLLGIVTRHRLDEAIRRVMGAGAAPAGFDERDVGAAMNALMGAQRSEILKRAGGLAGAQGVGLYLAGGVVRDILLGHVSRDLDLVVEGDGVAFAEELGRIAGARVIRHDSFGTAVVELQGEGRLDVTSARRETYDQPSMLPRVAPGSMLDDLLRRDVTINSMAIRLDGSRYGRLMDELGGERDLRAGLLRVNHMLSITEDPTRAIRIARFAGRFGFEPSDETLASLALAARAGAFAMLTGERLYREFSLIAEEEDPPASLSWCARLGLLAAIGPGLAWDAAARRAVARLKEGMRSGLLASLEGIPEVALMILMILSRRARPAQRSAVAERFRITGEVAERLRGFATSLADLLASLSPSARPSRIAHLCEQVRPEILALGWTTGREGQRRAIERYIKELRAVRPRLTGEALRAMGLPPGPAYREILNRLRQARLDGRVRDEASERKLAERLVASHAKTRRGKR